MGQENMFENPDFLNVKNKINEKIIDDEKANEFIQHPERGHEDEPAIQDIEGKANAAERIGSPEIEKAIEQADQLLGVEPNKPLDVDVN